MPARPGERFHELFRSGSARCCAHSTGCNWCAPPSHPRRADAARRLARASVAAAGIGAVVILALMFALDAAEIGLMPPRGTPVFGRFGS